MIGNDIISVAHLTKRTGDRKQRYYKKTYTENEIRLIETLNTPHVEGFFWALKESAYKACFRIESKVIVSPKKFEVLTFDVAYATVHTPVGIMDCVVEATEDYIYAVSQSLQLPSQRERFPLVNSPFERGARGIETNVFQIKENFHLEVKNKIAVEQNCSVKDIKIIKDKNNVPTLKVKNSNYLLSLSHDYNWGAYAYPKQPISV